MGGEAITGSEELERSSGPPTAQPKPDRRGSVNFYSPNEDYGDVGDADGDCDSEGVGDADGDCDTEGVGDTEGDGEADFDGMGERDGDD